jgi:hypothetical protein
MILRYPGNYRWFRQRFIRCGIAILTGKKPGEHGNAKLCHGKRGHFAGGSASGAGTTAQNPGRAPGRRAGNHPDPVRGGEIFRV